MTLTRRIPSCTVHLVVVFAVLLAGRDGSGGNGQLASRP